jgi:hypothetical protein
MPTVSITVALDVTERAKPPRAVFVPFMMGHHFGVPFHKELQRRVILTALEYLTAARQSGEIVSIPVTWTQARKEGNDIEISLGAAPGPSM